MRVLITGCSTGFGRVLAGELAQRGHEVIATARRPETLADLDVAERLALDVTSDASVAAAVEAAGPIDALVNNAGYGLFGPVECVPLAEVQRVMDTNYLGVVRMLQAVLPGMRARGGGRIVNVSSIAGRVASPLGGFYAASKYALEALSESLKYEVNHFGIHITVIEPGGFATGFQANEAIHGVDEPPYDALQAEWGDASARLRGDDPGEAPGPEAVVEAIASALASADPPFRVPVGADAEMIMAVRTSSDDATFEATMRAALGLTW